MRMIIKLAILAASASLLGGCVAKAVLDVATMPVRAAGKTYDVLTTSQSESDENRGRAMRHREEQLGRLDRDYRRQSDDCARGNENACRKRAETWAQIEALQRNPQR